MVPGALAFAAGSLLLATVGDDRALGVWALALVLMGAGVGTVFPTFQSAAVHAVPTRKFGIAAATTQTNIRVAGTLGVAVAVALVQGSTEATDSADASTFRSLWLLLAVLAIISALGSWRIDTRSTAADPLPAVLP